MAFGFFKKKKDEDANKKPLDYDPLNIKVKDLRKGFVFDFDFKSWEVLEEYEYDWGDYSFSKGLKIQADGAVKYLTLTSTPQGLEIVCTSSLMLSQVGPNLAHHIMTRNKPPETITFGGVVYYRERESPGFFRNVATTPREESVEFMSWDYYDESGKLLMSIEQWGDEEFEASVGQIVQEYDFSSILPGNQ